jgi:hypothetical protein
MNEDLRIILGGLWRVFRAGVLIVLGALLLTYMSIPCWILSYQLAFSRASYADDLGLGMVCCSFGASLLVLTGVAIWRIGRIQRRQRMAPARQPPRRER